MDSQEEQRFIHKPLYLTDIAPLLPCYYQSHPRVVRPWLGQTQCWVNVECLGTEWNTIYMKRERNNTRKLTGITGIRY